MPSWHVTSSQRATLFCVVLSIHVPCHATELESHFGNWLLYPTELRVHVPCHATELESHFGNWLLYPTELRGAIGSL